MTTTFIKNHELLKEDSHIEGLLDFSDIAKTFEKKLDLTFIQKMTNILL